MGRKYADAEAAADGLAEAIRRDPNYSPRTARFYRENSLLALRRVRLARPGATPYDVTAEDVRELVASMRSDGLAVSTQRDYVTSLNRLCEHVGNAAPRAYRPVWPADTRPRVDWLTPEEARRVLDHPMTPIQELIVTLELCMGLRRVEVIRLRLSDVHADYIDVTGKGRAGGKMRSVPIHSRVLRALSRWMVCREGLTLDARKRDARGIASDALLVWRRGADILPYSEIKGTGISKHLSDLSRAVGVRFGHHTLRRTFAREMWHAGVPLATIARILGHESTDQTLRYIGANMDDMMAAMAQFDFFPARR